MKKIKIIKIKEREDALHRNNIPEGFIKHGYMKDIPVVGSAFMLYSDVGLPFWYTSEVKEIIDESTFKTYNSIYQIIVKPEFEIV